MTKNTKINHKAKIKKMQLSFSFDLINMIDIDDEVFMVHNIIEEMNFDFFKSAYQGRGRKPSVNFKTMLKILIYAYLNRTYSSREIEKSCKFDLRYRWILGKSEAPSHVTINRFRNKIRKYLDEIFLQLIFILESYGEVNLKTLYIDGTKIESSANRYSFVWKKSIINYQNKLLDKIKKEFNLKDIDSQEAKKLILIEFNNIKNLCKKEKIVFVFGKGKRKTIEQRKYELYEEWIIKLDSYHKHLEIMGERNSYSKTDEDATFMRMKEDHMKNGQLKPAYNIQCATNGGYIVGIQGFSNPSDSRTLPLFLDDLKYSYNNKISRVVADSGYESEENYDYLYRNNIEAFIKPSNHEQKKKRKYKKDISKKENMRYLIDEDVYICANNRKLKYIKTNCKKTQSGYKIESKIYESESCSNCEHHEDCIKYKNKDNIKRISVSDKFNNFRRISEENINSKLGIIERINRSIQAEGIFSYIKSGMKYNRFNHIGKNNIDTELILLSLAINIKKFSMKIKNKKLGFTKYKKVY